MKRGCCSGDSLSRLVPSDLFYQLQLNGRVCVTLKLEGVNPAGSIKIKTAMSIIGDLESKGLNNSRHIIESSSGNLGIALSMLCANKGIPFTCVVDPRTPVNSVAMMRALGTTVVCVQERDVNGGFLGTRIAYIQAKVNTDDRYIWTNQYANNMNSRAHWETTAQEILRRMGAPSYLFVGTGTTGTLNGCSAYFREHSPTTKIVAVEPQGSITFGGSSSERKIPGLGTSRTPEIADPEAFDELVKVDDQSTIEMCRRVARQTGLLLGGSSGTVLSGVEQYFAERAVDGVVAISPDLGERYLSTIYNDEWVCAEFPDLVGELQIAQGRQRGLAGRVSDEFAAQLAERHCESVEQTSSGARIHFVSSDQIKPHERFSYRHMISLALDIVKTGKVLAPLVVDRKTLTLIDGHHRFAALAEHLSAPYVPCVLCDYLDDSSITVRPWRVGELVTKEEIVAAGEQKSLMPVKTTKHRFDNDIGSCEVDLKRLHSIERPALRKNGHSNASASLSI